MRSKYVTKINELSVSEPPGAFWKRLYEYRWKIKNLKPVFGKKKTIDEDGNTVWRLALDEKTDTLAIALFNGPVRLFDLKTNLFQKILSGKFPNLTKDNPEKKKNVKYFNSSVTSGGDGSLITAENIYEGSLFSTRDPKDVLITTWKLPEGNPISKKKIFKQILYLTNHRNVTGFITSDEIITLIESDEIIFQKRLNNLLPFRSREERRILQIRDNLVAFITHRGDIVEIWNYRTKDKNGKLIVEIENSNPNGNEGYNNILFHEDIMVSTLVSLGDRGEQLGYEIDVWDLNEEGDWIGGITFPEGGSAKDIQILEQKMLVVVEDRIDGYTLSKNVKLTYDGIIYQTDFTLNSLIFNDKYIVVGGMGGIIVIAKPDIELVSSFYRCSFCDGPAKMVEEKKEKEENNSNIYFCDINCQRKFYPPRLKV